MKTAASRKPARKSASKKPITSAAAFPAPAALLVGLTHVNPDAYPPDEEGRPWDGRSGCWGCDDDVANMRTLLEREGYDVSVLLDEKATIASVTRALDAHRAAIRKGGTFLFYYSGHGGQLADQNMDENDGMDETLCLFDGQLRDDDLNKTWVRFPGGTAIYMVADCCHSGSNFRALGRPQPVAVDFAKDLLGDDAMKAALLHLSGCKDEEYSEGVVDGGLFTKALVSIWKKGVYTGTWDTFHDEISAHLPASQRPQGNLYGPVRAAEALAKLRPFAPISRPAIATRALTAPAPRTLPALEEIARSASAAALRGAPRDVFTRDIPAASPSPAASIDILGEPGSLEFNRRVQERLSHHGLYDRLAIDGKVGPFTDWALGQFKAAAGTRAEAGIGPETAKALLRDDQDAFFPLDASGASLAARATRLLLAQGHWFSRHPETVNIVYLEGVNPDGSLNDDRPDAFNDLRLLIRVKGRIPELVGNWEATTEPGKFWTLNPMNPKGAARIAFGQYYAWSVGLHNSDHEALRQVTDVTVHRDKNKDFVRTGDALDTGLFFINQHWGYDQPQSNLGRSSAGCLVGRTTSGHRQFMKLVKADARFQASSGYRFTTTILDGSKLP